MPRPFGLAIEGHCNCAMQIVAGRCSSAARNLFCRACLKHPSCAVSLDSSTSGILTNSGYLSPYWRGTSQRLYGHGFAWPQPLLSHPLPMGRVPAGPSQVPLFE